MALDHKAKRKALLAELKALPPENKAEDIITLLDARRRGEKRRPSRICGDLLPYRYAKDRQVDLGNDVVTILMFVNLAHYLSKQDILTLARDTILFEKAQESLKDEKLPSSWSDCLREWSITSPELALEFYYEIRRVHSKSRKRGTETPVPEPKRQRVILPGTCDGSVQGRLPAANFERDSEQRKSEDGVTGSISTNVATLARSPESVAQQNSGISAAESTQIDRSQPASTVGCDARTKCPALTPEAQKKIMTMALSRCHVVVYPIEVFSELIRQTGQDVHFYRQDSGAHGYRASSLGPSAGKFYIQASEEVLTEIGHLCENRNDFVVPLSHVTRLFPTGGSSYATSIFWPTRGNITHVRKGCDVVWESALAWITFLNHLRSKPANITKLSLLHTLLLSYPVEQKT